ncbi:phage tail tube assembly chaperone [Lactobacillus sp. ESL0677]|uniref:phage tail tube assembly chaperone n=1 Tax=Lactobacillus sp. ESL0677 TaxID=2983208 RepID=UPI0023F6E3CA|nr:phage tail tube assembly chaperone [Lactobacillus sp. ESL0677]WEV36214.1 phage tail tube assembly chaperone [Lactobacillus sp. ESL0677]
MPKIKIDCKPLVGINKKVDVKPTIALENKVQDIKIEMLQVDNVDETSLEGLKFIRKANDDFVDFICLALNLSDEEKNTIVHTMTGEDLAKSCLTLLMQIQGATKSEVNDFWKQAKIAAKMEQQADPKGSKPKENKK